MCDTINAEREFIGCVIVKADYLKGCEWECLPGGKSYAGYAGAGTALVRFT